MADLGFPRGGGANSPGGAPTYDFAKFSQKLHEIERIWAPRGGRASKILLCRSATGNLSFPIGYQQNSQNIELSLILSSEYHVLRTHFYAEFFLRKENITQYVHFNAVICLILDSCSLNFCFRSRGMTGNDTFCHLIERYFACQRVSVLISSKSGLNFLTTGLCQGQLGLHCA